MSLLTVVRKAVAIANKVTMPLQAIVTHEAWLGADMFGEPTYGEPIQRRAIVDQTQREHRTGSGEMVSVQARIVFLEPIEPNGTAGRTEPIDANDRITLPDGSTGPIIDTAGFIDAGTNQPILSEIWLGRGKVGIGA